MIRIRYQTAVCALEKMDEKLNELGHDQWEFKSFSPFVSPDGEGINVILIMQQMYDDGEPDPNESGRRQGNSDAMKMKG